MSESDDDEIIYRFKIVKFVKRGRKGPTKQIDIVPSAWISWDEKTKRLKVPFLAPPYTKRNITELHDMVKQEAEAPESWPFYNIHIIGQAKTYTQAVDRLILLERTETAFSQDSDEDEEKVKKAETVYRQKKLKKNVEEIKHLFHESRNHLIKALSAALSNAKDWEGYRKERQVQKEKTIQVN